MCKINSYNNIEMSSIISHEHQEEGCRWWPIVAVVEHVGGYYTMSLLEKPFNC